MTQRARIFYVLFTGALTILAPSGMARTEKLPYVWPVYKPKLIQQNGKTVEVLTAVINGEKHAALDEVYYQAYNGKPFDYTEDYEDNPPYDRHQYHLSRDDKYLLVEWKAIRGTSVGYLYRVKAGQFELEPVHTRTGLRLDEAAWDHVRRTEKVAVPPTAPGDGWGHIIDFKPWPSNSEYIDMVLRCAREKQASHRLIKYGLRYRVRTGKFTITSRTYL